jgi:hypothetical protein
MDAKKEQEYQEKITALETQNKEFAERERLAAEAKAKAEKEAADLAAKTAHDAKVAEIKTFCETTIAANKMTPAEREKDEPIMLTLIDSPEALKSFQEKYNRAVVPTGEMQELNQQQKPPEGKLDKAAAYVKSHPTEFSGLDPQTAVARAVYLEGMGQIKF